ncbi:MAG: preprotein translocase subunit SecG [Phycisphaerales bacterium]
MLTFALMNEPISQLSAHSAMTGTLTLGLSPMMTNLLVGLFLLISVAMILLVLIQRPQGGGLSGAFGAGGGGGGAGQTAFGTKTGDVLTYGTIAIFIAFLLCAIVLNFAARPSTGPSTQPTLTAPQGTLPDQQGTQTGETEADGEPVDLSGTPGETVPGDDGDATTDPAGVGSGGDPVGGEPTEDE